MSNGALIGTGAIIAFLAIGGISSCKTIDAGEVGLYNRYGNIENAVASPGLRFINPITTSLETMNVQSQRWNGQTPIYTQDLQTAMVQFALTYSLNPDSAVRMRRSVGHEWADRLIPPITESAIKTIFGRVTAMNAIANRQTLQDQISQVVRARLRQRGINVEAFELTNIDYSDAFEASVERAQVATQDAVAARNATVRIREQANQRVIAATAEAEAIRITAQALEANPNLTQYRAVEKWNGVLPTNLYGSAPIPFISANR